MKIQLRFADPEKDASKVLAIYAPYILNTTITFEYEVPSLEAFQRRMGGVMEQFPWIVCEVDGVVAGYAYAAKQYERAAYGWNAELSVYLSPEFQGAGIGSALYRALIGVLQIQGYRNVSVRITIPNEKSIALHQAFGFEPVGTFHSVGNKFGRWLDMQCLTKQIGEYSEFPSPPQPVSMLNKEITDALFSACTQQIRVCARR